MQKIVNDNTIFNSDVSFNKPPILLYPNLSADRGDASVTLYYGSDAPTQRFLTNLTANRTITLSTVNAVAGAQFTIMTTNTGPGTLNINGLKTVPAATKAWCDLEYTGSAWQIIRYGLL